MWFRLLCLGMFLLGAALIATPGSAANIKKYHCPGGPGAIAYDIELDVAGQRLRTIDDLSDQEMWNKGKIEKGMFRAPGKEFAEYLNIKTGEHTVHLMGSISRRQWGDVGGGGSARKKRSFLRSLNENSEALYLSQKTGITS